MANIRLLSLTFFRAQLPGDSAHFIKNNIVRLYALVIDLILIYSLFVYSKYAMMCNHINLLTIRIQHVRNDVQSQPRSWLYTRKRCLTEFSECLINQRFVLAHFIGASFCVFIGNVSIKNLYTVYAWLYNWRRNRIIIIIIIVIIIVVISISRSSPSLLNH